MVFREQIAVTRIFESQKKLNNVSFYNFYWAMQLIGNIKLICNMCYLVCLDKGFFSNVANCHSGYAIECSTNYAANKRNGFS